MKILVTGREGQVATALAAAAGPSVELVCTSRAELDLRDPRSIYATVTAHRPDIVVNPAAFTAVDKAESESEVAFAINRDGAGHVAAAAARLGIPVIHVSTDYVFDGDKDSPYFETDATGPQSVYGASKLAGELAVAHANPDYVIVRTAWVFAPGGNNFARTMVRLAADRDSVRVVADQRGTPTYAPDIAEAILAIAGLVHAAPEKRGWRGIFHLTNGGETTWAGFADEIFARSAEQDGPSARVEPIDTADYPTRARRPANSRLDTSKLFTTFGVQLPDWKDGVRRWVAAEKVTNVT